MHASTSPADPPASMPTADSAIVGLDQPVIMSYFETINAGEFEATGALFEADGVLQPPFEQGIVGPSAIAEYLQREAKGFTLQPKEATIQRLEDGCSEVEVVGRVQTPLFSVNVSWQFVLSPEREIRFAKIKLLAALKELLNLRQQGESDLATQAESDA